MEKSSDLPKWYPNQNSPNRRSSRSLVPTNTTYHVTIISCTLRPRYLCLWYKKSASTRTQVTHKEKFWRLYFYHDIKNATGQRARSECRGRLRRSEYEYYLPLPLQLQHVASTGACIQEQVQYPGILAGIWRSRIEQQFFDKGFAAKISHFWSVFVAVAVGRGQRPKVKMGEDWATVFRQKSRRQLFTCWSVHVEVIIATRQVRMPEANSIFPFAFKIHRTPLVSEAAFSNAVFFVVTVR